MRRAAFSLAVTAGAVDAFIRGVVERHGRIDGLVNCVGSIVLKASEGMHPLGRIGRPEEVARVICWLLGPDSSWVTGQVIGIDGGLSTVRAKATA